MLLAEIGRMVMGRKGWIWKSFLWWNHQELQIALVVVDEKIREIKHFSWLRAVPLLKDGKLEEG